MFFAIFFALASRKTLREKTADQTDEARGVRRVARVVLAPDDLVQAAEHLATG